jgi:hypothetical protein
LICQFSSFAVAIISKRYGVPGPFSIELRNGSRRAGKCLQKHRDLARQFWLRIFGNPQKCFYSPIADWMSLFVSRSFAACCVLIISIACVGTLDAKQEKQHREDPMTYIVRSVLEEGNYREVERVVSEMKSMRREVKAAHRKHRRPKV